MGKILTVSNTHSNILFFLIMEGGVPGVFLTRFCPQFSFICLLQKVFPLTNANTTINSSHNSLAGANA